MLLSYRECLENMVQIIELKKHTGRSSIYNRKWSLFRG